MDSLESDDYLEMNDRPYTVLRGETLWSIAAKFKIDAEELLFYNSLKEPNQLEAGMEIHLPIVDTPAVPEDVITYELHNPTRQMHITKEGGAHKWAFGNAKKLTDIVKSGSTWKWNAPVEIVATAQVPLKEGTASYYMTAGDLGTYRDTGKIGMNIGFNHTHLADGEPVEVPVEPPAPIVTPEVVIADVHSYIEGPNVYKQSWWRFRETGIYRVKNAIWVKEYDGRQEDHFLNEGEKVELIGTFMRGDTIYGRPWSGTNNFWFGIPMSCLEPIDENADIDTIADVPLPEKIAAKLPLSPSEKVWDVVSHTVGRGVRLSETIKKKITGKV